MSKIQRSPILSSLIVYVMSFAKVTTDGETDRNKKVGRHEDKETEKQKDKKEDNGKIERQRDRGTITTKWKAERQRDKEWIRQGDRQGKRQRDSGTKTKRMKRHRGDKETQKQSKD